MPVETEQQERQQSETDEVNDAAVQDDSKHGQPEDAAAEADDSDGVAATAVDSPRSGRWKRLVAYGLLPALALGAGVAAGAFKWMSGAATDATAAATESVQAARDSTVAMLSYQPDNVQAALEGVRSRLTGSFRDSYDKLIHDVVIPGAKQQQISAIANVPAAASISANGNHATVLVFVDQTSITGKDAPVNTASTVRVTLDKVDGSWLISAFDPV